MDTDSLVWALFMLPGFAAYRVFAAMTVRRRQPALVTVSEVLLFELVSVAVYAVLADRSPDTLLQLASHATAGAATGLNWQSIVTLACISLLVGVVSAALSNWDRFLGPLRGMQLTRQSVHPTVWQAAFQHRRGWVVVHLENELRIQGFVKYFSDTPGEGSLYLESAKFLSRSSPSVPVGDLLLVRQSQIAMIQFLDPEKDDRCSLRVNADMNAMTARLSRIALLRTAKSTRMPGGDEFPYEKRTGVNSDPKGRGPKEPPPPPKKEDR
ncbi:MAG: hypothetical protein IPJ77_11335 [Planctomycetes bacterium]|nr:hypothetical protein [Planctomycetota bacterium]